MMQRRSGIAIEVIASRVGMEGRISMRGPIPSRSSQSTNCPRSSPASTARGGQRCRWCFSPSLDPPSTHPRPTFFAPLIHAKTPPMLFGLRITTFSLSSAPDSPLALHDSYIRERIPLGNGKSFACVSQTISLIFAGFVNQSSRESARQTF